MKQKSFCPLSLSCGVFTLGAVTWGVNFSHTRLVVSGLLKSEHGNFRGEVILTKYSIWLRRRRQSHDKGPPVAFTFCDSTFLIPK